MQQTERKYFVSPDSGLDSDSADFALSPNAWVNAENLRTLSTDRGVVGAVESVGGTTLVSAAEPSVSHLAIGSAEDEEQGRLLTFLYDLYGSQHKIKCNYPRTGAEYTVLLSSQVSGGLNFSKNSPIHSARVVNGMLYWPDGTSNEPRGISIDGGIRMNHPDFQSTEEAYVAPLNFSEITLIKPPPALAPVIAKDTDSGFENNFVANDSFMFAWQLVYQTNETSVTGPYSTASKLNKIGDDYNRIVVTMDNREAVPASVKMVNLIVRFSNSNTAKVVKTWDRAISSEAAQIEAQNDGTVQLAYNFYNNITGATLPESLVLKPFDSVPIYTQCLEAARNRLFLARNTVGYNTPVTTSLGYGTTTVDVSGGSFTKPLIQLDYQRPDGFNPANWYFYRAWCVELTEVVPAGIYVLNATVTTKMGAPPPAFPAAPTTVAFSGLTFYGATGVEVDSYIDAITGFTDYTSCDFTWTANEVEITGLTVDTFEVFKTRSQYKLGVVFYDYALRKCGVVTNDGLVVSIPSRTYAFTQGINGVTWNLSNANALGEIPDWAYYYAVVRTLNLRTRFFIQSFDDALKYATRDADGQYVFTDTTFVTACVGLALNTTAIFRSGLGYVYTEGDVCVLVGEDDTIYELPVIGQSGNYVIVKPVDLGDVSAKKFVYELYTPYQTSEQELFFEMGEMNRVSNPGTDSRSYETLTGLFGADSFVFTRNYNSTTYFAEGMSPNDLFYNRWDNDGGKPNIVTKLGRQSKEQTICFSNTFIPGTAVNGLSTFDPLDEKAVGQECGAVQKLQLTSKVQNEGTVMLAICTNETNSVYLGETQILDATGAAQFIAQSSGVIGSINTLKGSYGTQNPESVTEYKGNVYWLDINSGKYIQYASNGLYPISNYRMTRFWKSFSDQYKAMTAAEIEALGSRPFIFSVVDPRHDELLVTLPRLLAAPPKGYLPDYPEMIYPFDIWDGQAKTLVYKLAAEPNRWQGSYSWDPEGLATLQNELYSFKNGFLWLHNQPSHNNFYGVAYKARLMFIGNALPGVPKVYNNIAVEGNTTPSLTYFRSEEPWQQASDLMDFDWKNLEGRLYATLFRDKLVPTATGMATTGLLTGQKLRTPALRLLLEFEVGATPLELRFVTIGFDISRGHR